MSLRSMTGFGRGTARSGGLRLDVEMSSVNRKQFDCQVNLPRGLAPLESRVQEEVARDISRGRINVQVSLRGATPGAAVVRVDEILLKAYLDTVRRAARRHGLAGDLSARDLMDLPGVLTHESPQDDVEACWSVLLRALTQARRGLGRMRRREGTSLTRDLTARLRRLGRLVAAIHRQAPRSLLRYRRQLRARIAAALKDLPVPEDRLERELVIFADKSDVTEELTRLKSHLAQAAHLCGSTDPAGKSLDFLAQEMYREINTIGSKASDAAITRRVVEFKAELERIREQAQNIE